MDALLSHDLTSFRSLVSALCGCNAPDRMEKDVRFDYQASESKTRAAKRLRLFRQEVEHGVGCGEKRSTHIKTCAKSMCATGERGEELRMTEGRGIADDKK